MRRGDKESTIKKKDDMKICWKSFNGETDLKDN